MGVNSKSDPKEIRMVGERRLSHNGQFWATQEDIGGRMGTKA